MGSRTLVVLAAVVSLGIGSAFGSALAGQNSEAASQGQIVKQLKKLNANLGNRYSAENVITLLDKIRQSTFETCKATASSSFTPC